MSGLLAGAATADITPRGPQFLYGYPHVPRTSTGVHDPLQGGALYLSDGRASLLLCSADVIFIGKDLAARVRARIEAAAGIPGGSVLVSATHTHSGPVTVDYLSNSADPVVPKADAAYLRVLEDGQLERIGSTTTLVPTVTRLNRSATSSLVRRMQPEETNLPMVEGSFVP